jgi:hypothetical protein
MRLIHRMPTLARRAIIALVGMGVVGSVGCSRTVEAEPPPPRYQARPAKTDLPEHLRGTIFELVDVGGVRPVSAAGYGLVVNLDNTGRDDGIPTTVRESVLRTAQVRGVSDSSALNPLADLSPASLLGDPRTAVVRVEAIIPPAASAGDRVDVVVRALPSNTTPSLARGFLWQTDIFSGRVDAQNPGEQVNRIGAARGALMVNPGFALLDPAEIRDDPAATASLRTGVIPGGAIVQQTRHFTLRLRNPSRRDARLLQRRINLHFGSPVAEARDEAIIRVRPPVRGHYAGVEWRHFLSVTLGLYLRADNQFGVAQAERLGDMLIDPMVDDATRLEISYALEGIGQTAMPTLLKYVGDPNPSVDFHASRAAAHLGESVAIDRLVAMGAEDWNPYALRGTVEAGRLGTFGARSLTRGLRRLLNGDVAANPQVRIAAYEGLVRLGDDRAVFMDVLEDNFHLHVAPAEGEALVYARRTGTPTLAVIGGGYDPEAAPRVKADTLLTAFGDRLSISRGSADRFVSLFQRRNLPETAIDVRRFVRTRSMPDLVEVIGRLGGGGAQHEARLRVNYGDVVALVKEMGDRGMLVAGPDGGQRVDVRLEDLILEQVDSPPVIPDLPPSPATPPARAAAAN